MLPINNYLNIKHTLQTINFYIFVHNDFCVKERISRTPSDIFISSKVPVSTTILLRANNIFFLDHLIENIRVKIFVFIFYYFNQMWL